MIGLPAFLVLRLPENNELTSLYVRHKVITVTKLRLSASGIGHRIMWWTSSDVLEESTTKISGGLHYPEEREISDVLGMIYQARRCHTPEDNNINCYWNCHDSVSAPT